MRKNNKEENSELYYMILKEYDINKSIAQVAKKLQISEERVRRTLITEGLWTSRSAKPIVDLYRQGKTVPEIAEELMISEKTVQSYIPYSRGMYGGERSDTAERSNDYRVRMKDAADKMKSLVINESSNIIIKDDTYIESEKKDNIDISKKNIKQAWERSYDNNGLKRDFVYQLRFDLVGGYFQDYSEDYGMNPYELKDFLKLAKAEKGISRTALVPGCMNLHALHYMILRLFGWQNEHLHKFSFKDEDFNKLTDEQKLGSWMSVCGNLLRFPETNNSDVYWDEDYKPEESVKSWLKKKYKGPYKQLCTIESMWKSFEEINKFNEEFILADSVYDKKNNLSVDSTIKDLNEVVWFEDNFNTILERLTLEELLLSVDEIGEKKNSYKDWRDFINFSRKEAVKTILDAYKDGDFKDHLNECIDDLVYWRELKDNIERNIYYGHKAELKKHFGKDPMKVKEEAERAISSLQDYTIEILDEFNPKMRPFFDTIYYYYDFGDGWVVRITCEKRFRRVSEWDKPDKNGWIIAGTMNERDGFESFRYYDENGMEVIGALHDKLARVDIKQVPICIRTDGLSLVEDVGGIYGFYDMLKILSGNDIDEKTQTRTWAKGLGWTGRISKAENML